MTIKYLAECITIITLTVSGVALGVGIGFLMG